MPATPAPPHFLNVVTDPRIPILHPMATAEIGLRAPFGYTERLSDHAGPIHPRMSPPQELTVDDQPARTVATMSTTPTLRWQRPSLGTPTSYQIQLFRVFVDVGGATNIEPDIAFLSTPNTEITIPPGILVAGEYYVIYVNATSGTVSNAPFRKRFPQAFAPVVSGVIQAQ